MSRIPRIAPGVPIPAATLVARRDGLPPPGPVEPDAGPRTRPPHYQRRGGRRVREARERRERGVLFRAETQLQRLAETWADEARAARVAGDIGVARDAASARDDAAEMARACRVARMGDRDGELRLRAEPHVVVETRRTTGDHDDSGTYRPGRTPATERVYPVRPGDRAKPVGVPDTAYRRDCEPGGWRHTPEGAALTREHGARQGLLSAGADLARVRALAWERRRWRRAHPPQALTRRTEGW